MKKVSLLAGLLVIVVMLSGCMAFDHSIDRNNSGNERRGGHSSHH